MKILFLGDVVGKSGCLAVTENLPDLIKKKKIDKKINYIIKQLKKAQKPVIILGGGIKYAKAEKRLNLFLRKFNIPIVSTWSGVDLIDHAEKKYIGNIDFLGISEGLEEMI